MTPHFGVSSPPCAGSCSSSSSRWACAGDAQAQDRYSLVGGCYALKSAATGKFVANTADGGYRATAGRAGGAEPLRMQATDLGRYLLYGAKRDFVGVGKPLPLPRAVADLADPGARPPGRGHHADRDRVQSAASPSETADWRVSQAGGDFVIDLPAARGQVLTVAGDGTVIMRDRAAAGTRGRWAFVPRGGCPAYPEIPLDVSGPVRTGSGPWSAVHGLIDGHMHMMAFEFLGGRVHCGRPWHPYGVPYAMVDCPDHYPNGAGAVGENVLSYGSPAHLHRPGRLADIQGLAVVRLADPRAEPLPLARALVAGRPARVR